MNQKIAEWVDVRTIKALSKHTTGVLSALLFYGLIDLVAWLIIRDDRVKLGLRIVEDAALLGFLVLFLIHVFRDLWRGLSNGNALALAA